MTNSHDPLPGQDILGLLATSGIPEDPWFHGDDKCDCTFQRIGDWTNPVIGRTLRVRLCCIWAKIYAQYPEFVQEIPAYHNIKTNEYVNEPQDWNAEDWDMPRYLWYRHLAAKYGRPLSEIREKCKDMEPPKRLPPGTGQHIIPTIKE